MAYLPYDPGDDVTELSPAVTQFTNNPAMVAITKKVRQFTDDPNKSNDPDWEYLPNISQRNDPGTMAATGGDNRAEAAVGGYGYSGDPDQMGPAIDFMKRMEDTYGDSIAREEREKQEIANSPSETYDPVGFRQAIVESLKYDPMKIDVVKEVDAKYGQVEQQIFSQMFPGKRWGKSSLTAKEYSVYDKARKDSYVMLHNEVQGKVDRGNDIIKQNLEMYDKEFKYKEGLRKEADIKKEKEATKAENLRRYKIEQENKKLDREGKGESKTTKKVWDKTADMYVYRTDDQISKEPDRYGMNKKTAMEIKRAGAINLGDAKLKQNVKTPEFSSKATKAAKTIVGKTWDVMEPEQKKLAIKMEMDKQIRAIYGDEDVVFGRDKETGIVGWYDSNGALIRRYE